MSLLPVTIVHCGAKLSYRDYGALLVLSNTELVSDCLRLVPDRSAKRFRMLIIEGLQGPTLTYRR